jgi:dolichol-phosphate mannosyltransferase
VFLAGGACLITVGKSPDCRLKAWKGKTQMNSGLYERAYKLSVVIPCFNEEKTLKKCVKKVLALADEQLSLEIIIVDDCSQDRSLEIAKSLESQHREITVLHHEKNQGKGAALRTGFQEATGDFVAVQDADLEYNPQDLKRLLIPLRNGEADVVLGSRFLSVGSHRVLYFWHSIGNRLLTCLSNMFTDLNLTDMETCYKVFRREVIQSINIEEKRFGFEPEIVAKLAHMRLRIYEMGISYRGRTYEEGKKIGAKDGIRALYCIFRYNAHRAPLPIQFFFYLFIGGISALFNLFIFLILISFEMNYSISAYTAFITSAFLNYILCVFFLFRRNAKWKSTTEMTIFVSVVSIVGIIDVQTTNLFLSWNFPPGVSKSLASILCLFFNFLGRRFVVFPEPASGPWAPQGDVQDVEELDEVLTPVVSSDPAASRK